MRVETLRYYERQGLVARPPRSMSNYRLYPADIVRRLRFIKHAQALGFSLKEIKELLSLWAAPRARCADVRERAEAKIKDIEAKVRSLQATKKALAQLVAECAGFGPITDCPILESLDAEEEFMGRRTSPPKPSSRRSASRRSAMTRPDSHLSS